MLHLSSTQLSKLVSDSRAEKTLETRADIDQSILLDYLPNEHPDPYASISISSRRTDQTVFESISPDTIYLYERQKIYECGKPKSWASLCPQYVSLWRMKFPLHYNPREHAEKVEQPHHLEPLPYVANLTHQFQNKRWVKKKTKNNKKYIHLEGEDNKVTDMSTNNAASKHLYIPYSEQFTPKSKSQIAMKKNIENHNYPTMKQAIAENDKRILELASRDTVYKFTSPHKYFSRISRPSSVDFVQLVQMPKHTKNGSYLSRQHTRKQSKPYFLHYAPSCNLSSSKSSSTLPISSITKVCRLNHRLIEAKSSRTCNMKRNYLKTGNDEHNPLCPIIAPHAEKKSKRQFPWNPKFSKSLWVPNTGIIAFHSNLPRELDSIPVRLNKDMYHAEQSMVWTMIAVTENINGVDGVLKFPHLCEISLGEPKNNFGMEINLNKSIQDSFNYDYICYSLSNDALVHNFVPSPFIKMETEDETITIYSTSQLNKVTTLDKKIMKVTGSERFSHRSRSVICNISLNKNTTYTEDFGHRTANENSISEFIKDHQETDDDNITDSVSIEQPTTTLSTEQPKEIPRNKVSYPWPISKSTWDWVSENMEFNRILSMNTDNQANGDETTNNLISDQNYISNFKKKMKAIKRNGRSSACSQRAENDNSTTACESDSQMVETNSAQLSITDHQANGDEATNKKSSSDQNCIFKFKKKMKIISKNGRSSVLSQVLGKDNLSTEFKSDSQLGDPTSLYSTIADENVNVNEVFTKNLPSEQHTRFNFKKKIKKYVGYKQPSVCREIFKQENLTNIFEFISQLAESDSIQPNNINKTNKIERHIVETFNNEIMTFTRIRRSTLSSKSDCSHTNKNCTNQLHLASPSAETNNIETDDMTLASQSVGRDPIQPNLMDLGTQSLIPNHIHLNNLELASQSVEINHIVPDNLNSPLHLMKQDNLELASKVVSLENNKHTEADLEDNADGTIRTIRKTLANFRKGNWFFSKNNRSSHSFKSPCSQIYANEKANKYLELDSQVVKTRPITSIIIEEPAKEVLRSSRIHLRLSGFRRAKSTADVEKLETEASSEPGFLQKFQKRLRKVSSGNRKT